ncbi:MAG TPA: D-aminoacyl-tRNA deacylase, partial [Porticoccaceae bacterium]
MLALLQRVSHASVTVEGITVGAIEHGLLVLLGVERNDDLTHCERLADKVVN